MLLTVDSSNVKSLIGFSVSLILSQVRHIAFDLVRPLGLEPRTCGLRGVHKVSELIVNLSEYVSFLQLIEVFWQGC